MAKVLENLLYTKSHEWVKVDGAIATVGVTDFAQDSLGSVVYVEGFLDEHVDKDAECGAIESVKAASDIMAPVSGTVIEVNEKVIDSPELVNDDPYKNWILKIEMDDASELDLLLKASDYEKECK